MKPILTTIILSLSLSSMPMATEETAPSHQQEKPTTATTKTEDGNKLRTFLDQTFIPLFKAHAPREQLYAAVDQFIADNNDLQPETKQSVLLSFVAGHQMKTGDAAGAKKTLTRIIEIKKDSEIAQKAECLLKNGAK